MTLYIKYLYNIIFIIIYDMKEDFNFDNIPLDSLWFDTLELKEQRTNNYMQELATVIQSECDSIPEVKKFKSIMNHFFIGKVELTDRWIYIPEALNLTEGNAEEVYEVVNNYIEYPDDENLKAEIFTQKINTELWNDLSQYGITLDNKYKIKNNNGIFYVSPIFHISDPDLFIEFLQKVKICDDETALHIDTILWTNEMRLEKIILKWNSILNSSEAVNFIIKSFDIWEEIKRLEIEGTLINLQIRDIALVTSTGLLEDYLKFKKLWFFAQLYPDDYKNDLKIPSFIYDVLYICNQYEEIEELYNCIASIRANISESLILLSNIRHNNILFQPLKEELELWINQLIEYINDNPNIENEEKSKIVWPVIKQAKELSIL